MDLRFSREDERFRDQVRTWLEENLADGFADLRGRGGPGEEHALIDERRVWERRLAEGGWTGLAWPADCGGRDATLMQQVIYNEEYAAARAPGRVGHIGETLLGPTIIAYGSQAQKDRFLPKILSGEELWCQGYSEPNAGSDLANVQCRAVEVDGAWSITGQKVWTSLAQWSEWCFALCRTDLNARKHKGISYLLVPMDQPGVTMRPIEQITGGSEFCEVFFDGARAELGHVVGPVNGGWKVAMGTLALERGASTLAQQIGFRNELAEVIAAARRTGAAKDIRQRIARAVTGLRIMRLYALRNLTAMERGELTREGMITKLYWSHWHRDLGELAVDVLGDEAELLSGPGYPLGALQRLFLWTRCDTIYAGTSQVQRNIIGERALGLPREPRP